MNCRHTLNPGVLSQLNDYNRAPQRLFLRAKRACFESRFREVFWPSENLCIFQVVGAPHRVQSAFAFAGGRKFLEGRTSIAPRIEAFHWLPILRIALNLNPAAVAD
jgi:hypothetical protein